MQITQNTVHRIPYRYAHVAHDQVSALVNPDPTLSMCYSVRPRILMIPLYIQLVTWA